MPAANTQTKVCVMWFRRDLRLKDNTALAKALSSGLPVLPIFIFDPAILERLKEQSDLRVQFIHSAVLEMANELRQRGRAFQIFHDDPKKVFHDLLVRFSISDVYANEDYEPYARSRDAAMEKLLQVAGVKLHLSKDQVIFSKDDVLKDDGTPYTVFTPYKRRWLNTLTSSDLVEQPSTALLDGVLKGPTQPLELTDLGFKKTNFDFPKRNVRAALLKNYDKTRDIPALNGTSRLSVHFRFGTVSPRKAVSVAQATSDTWLSELIWREFFMQILWHFPHVATSSFRAEYDTIRWTEDDALFSSWCEGRTGFPLVDAGMRELNETGFMHNRVRMVTASFLVKDLLIDWRKGEQYFADRLLDFDLSANNGNWQWAAGTGCDAAPYFRIFNPESQQKKFDPEFKYIKTWLPEYGTKDYPPPIVDHGKARLAALAAYKKALGRNR
jgi:deoxyribodipyrimidine photo-lyase